MADRSVTRDIPKQSLRAMFDASTVNVEKRTVDLIWTTGSRVLRGGAFTEPYYEELSLDPKHVRMERMQSGAAPLLNSHSAGTINDVLGVVENARLEKGQGVATVRFDSGTEGEDAFRRVREGTLRNVSVGYTTSKMQEVKDSSTSTPVYRAIDWAPYEISLVPIGADAGAVTRSEGGLSPCEFIQERHMADSEKPTIIPAPVSEPAIPAAPSMDSVRSMERERISGIHRVARKLNRPEAEVTSAIENGTELHAYRAHAIESHGETGTIQIDKRDPRITPGEDSRDKWMRGASAWLLQRAAVGNIVAADAKAKGEKIDLDPGHFRGLRMIDLARQALENSGVRTAGMLPMDLVGLALTQRSSGMTGAASTGDFPVLLENVLYKTLIAAYGTTPDTWTRFAMTGSVQDFRANKRYRIGTFGALQTVNEGGEFANKAIPDGSRESLTAQTKGNIVSITRQAIINDDMGAFTTLATMLGRSARLTIELDVYALLAQNGGLGPLMGDGLTLFHANHKNITTSAAMSAGAIDLDRQAMASQTDLSGNEILGLTPAILLLPITLGGVARQINTGQYDFDASTGKNPWLPNRVGGLFHQIIDSPRIAGTRRYVFADPGIAPTIEVAFLDGQQQPFLDVQQGWRVDGVEWKARLDYGVAAIDYRGAVTNAGV